MTGKYELVLFDLDGTLTNSEKGITNSLIKAFKAMGKPVPGIETLRRFIGPPMWDSMRLITRLSDKEAAEAIAIYKKEYRAKGFFENEVYGGIPELLQSLLEAGAELAVATSKPVTPTRAILDYFGLTRYFKYISAEDDSERGGGKEKLIRKVLKESGVPAGKAVMVGDTKFDAAGAVRAGTPFIGVLYGFGSKEEMGMEGAADFAASPAELGKMLLNP
jgi:phosphoglycolate phosphatase